MSKIIQTVHLLIHFVSPILCIYNISYYMIFFFCFITYTRSKWLHLHAAKINDSRNNSKTRVLMSLSTEE